MASVRALSSTLVVLGLVMGCSGGDGNPNPNLEPPVEATLRSLSVTTGLSETESIALGRLLQAEVTATYSDDSTKTVTDEVVWSSNKPNVLAVVEDTPGAFRGVAEGNAAIIATLDSESVSVNVVVGPLEVDALQMVPNSGEIGMGGALNLAIVATYSDGERVTVTENVEWDSSDGFILRSSASSPGRLVPFGEGSATISATLDGMQASGSFTVVPPKLEYIFINAPEGRLELDAPVQLSADGIRTDDEVLNLTNTVTWTSSNEAVATVTASGLVTAVAEGEVVMTASADGIEASTILKTIGGAECSYPTDFVDRVEYNTVIPPMFWLDAYDESGNLVDFRLDRAHCDSDIYETIIFVVGAGWCGACPPYMRRVNEIAEELAEAKSRIVYVQIETANGTEASNAQAHNIVESEVPDGAPSIRVGDGATSGTVNLPFRRAVSSIPDAFVVRTADMRIIAHLRYDRTTGLDLVRVAQNPNRLH